LRNGEKKDGKMNNATLNGIRWFARIVGSLLVLFFLLMVLGYIIEPQGTGKITLSEIPLIIGMAAMLLGIIIAWFREGIGAFLTIGGFLFFFASELISTRSFKTWILVAYPTIGLLFLACWLQSRQH
jgi:hypothetical protein